MPTRCPTSHSTLCSDHNIDGDSPSFHRRTPKEIAAIERTSERHFYAWLESLAPAPIKRDDEQNQPAPPTIGRGHLDEEAEDEDEDESTLYSRVYDAADEEITIWRIKCRVCCIKLIHRITL